HAADDGADPGIEADEPVRRGGGADVRLVRAENGPDAVPAPQAGGRSGGEERRGRLGGEGIPGVRLREGGSGGRPAVQRGDLAFGEGGGADAAAGAGGVRHAATEGGRLRAAVLRFGGEGRKRLTRQRSPRRRPRGGARPRRR